MIEIRQVEIRKGQASAPLSRLAFGERYRAVFVDPAYAAETEGIARWAPEPA